MLLTKRLKIKWFPANKKHYVSLGYKFTNYGDEFEIDVNDLSKPKMYLFKWLLMYVMLIQQ